MYVKMAVSMLHAKVALNFNQGERKRVMRMHACVLCQR